MGSDDGDWLSRDEAVALVRSREPMSIGMAEAAVRAASKSGEVRSHVLTEEARSLLGFDAKPAKNSTSGHSTARPTLLIGSTVTGRCNKGAGPARRQNTIGGLMSSNFGNCGKAGATLENPRIAPKTGTAGPQPQGCL